jgi:glycosyltransferase involved in cell wall biosynthesis
MEKTSVIIPTFRSPDFLDLALQSCIEGQQIENEIIVVVDGHYDINKDILEKYAKSIEILNLDENVGLCRATNLGVYNASNELILIVNDDNIFQNKWDLRLNEIYQPNSVISPNQIEPYPSMFSQFRIKDLGTDPKAFDLNKFREFCDTIEKDITTEEGSTLPIFMSKMDYLKVGGWDENYEQGMVADWDFFLKCQLSGLKMLRTYNCHFYHFASVSVNGEKRRQAEAQGHEYAKYKWGDYIKHNPNTNLKYL